MAATSSEPEPGARALSRLGRAALVAATVAYAVQVGLVLAVLIGLATGSPGISLTASGARSAIVGASPVVRVEAWRGYGEPYGGRIELTVVDGASQQPCVDGGDAGWFCTLPAPAAPGPYVATIRAAVAAERVPVELIVALQARAGSGALLERGETTRVPSARGRSVADPRGEPVLSVIESAGCGRSLGAWPESGIPVANVEQRVWLRLVEGGGTPVAQASIACSSDRGPLAPVTTDELGTAALTMRPEWEERIRCVVPCADGGTFNPTLHVVPSWDGLLVGPTQGSVGAQLPARIAVAHQRQSGQWFAGLWCDGVRVWGATVAVRPGRGAFDVPVPRLPGDHARLCVLQASTSPRGTPTSRSSHRLLVRAPGSDERTATGVLASAVAAAGGPAAPWVADGTRSALAGAAEGAVERLALATLSSLPQTWYAEEVVADGVAIAAAADSERRAALRTRAVVVLGLDGALLVLVVFGVWLPVWSRQRGALRAELDADDDAHRLAEVSGAMGMVPLLAFAVGSAVMFIVGLAVLLSAID